jgi:hypothetical protein
MSRSYTSSPPSAFMACSGTALAYYVLKHTAFKNKATVSVKSSVEGISLYYIPERHWAYFRIGSERESMSLKNIANYVSASKQSTKYVKYK